KGNFRTYNNLLATFILGGIWHGAGWTFVFWGLLHGIALVINRIWQNFNFHMSKILAWFITFNFLNITWVFFRAKEWDDAIKVLEGMFGLSGIVLQEKYLKLIPSFVDLNIQAGRVTEHLVDGTKILIWILVVFIILSLNNSVYQLKNFKLNYKTVTLSGIAFAASILSFNKVSEFLYFNF
ncbi:MAG: MBOAT family protein, partial [Sulfurimonas sp.]|nr:MBOAT family protein [Sulfurimonas sp.]